MNKFVISIQFEASDESSALALANYLGEKALERVREGEDASNYGEAGIAIAKVDEADDAPVE